MLKTTDPFTIESVVRKAIQNSLMDLHTVHPCKVRQVRDDGTVDVDLMIHSVFVDGTSKALPSITQLPILFQGNSTYAITFPISVGDEGLALFSERDISRFLESGETGEPNALRLHDLSDGIFMPTPISKPNLLAAKTDSLLISNSGTEIEITNGLIRFNGDIELNGNVEINGEITAKQNIKVEGDLNADGEVSAQSILPATKISLSTHLTTGVTTGPGVSGPPQIGT